MLSSQYDHNGIAKYLQISNCSIYWVSSYSVVYNRWGRVGIVEGGWKNLQNLSSGEVGK